MLIIGAGLSGIGAACHLRKELPGKRFMILEARDDLGGTWDLFRYPGVRSDSDMFSLGYGFRPWNDAAAIADGGRILGYLRATASEYGVDRMIRFRHRVTRASWSSQEGRWTVEAACGGDAATITRFSCRFLYANTGYYRYDRGYDPVLPGAERFKGPVIHPQRWPDGLDWTGQRIAVIGSGATAITLVPALAQQARQVTMVQRSPSYILSQPARDPLAARLSTKLPARAAFSITRWKNILLTTGLYQLSRLRPGLVRRLLTQRAIRQLPGGYDVGTHFRPRYAPWDQRLCLVPDGDLFRAIRSGRATIATGAISSITADGIEMASGEVIPADIIVTATGLNLLLLGGIDVTVDGQPIDFARTVSYRGAMFSGVPNFAATVGYTNASWTLKADLIARYVVRLMKHMDRHQYRQATPLPPPADQPRRPLIGLTSGYVLRSLDRLPQQGSRPPWRVHQNYPRDLLSYRYGRLNDAGIMFSGGRPAATPTTASPTRSGTPHQEPTG